MPHVIHEAVTIDGQTVWRRCRNPDFVEEFGSETVLRLPRTAQATCDGARVVGGIQRLSPDNLVRIELADKPVWRLHVGAAIATTESGNGRPDDFTGLPIEGEALRCPQCRSLYAARTAVQLKQECPNCHAALRDGNDVPAPPEELL